MNGPRRICTAGVCGVLATVVSYAQIGKITQQDWVTSRGDAQRTSWIQSDVAISPESMQKPGFRFQWKVTLENQSRQLNSLAAGVVFGNLGFGSKPVSFITGSGNRVFAVDNDTGNVSWQHAFEGGGGSAGTIECPGGMTGAATRPATLAPVIPVWRGVQDRPAYTSGVGAPGEGVPAYLLGRGAARAAAPTPVAPAPAPAPAPARAAGPPPANQPARAGGPAPAPTPTPQVVYALSSDGQLHTLGLYTGKDTARPLPFLPPNAHASDLIAINNIVYATTMNGCGGVPDGVWALDLADKSVRNWTPGGISPIGAPAFGTDGTLYVAVGFRNPGGVAGKVVELDPRELTVKHTSPAEFATMPVVFTMGNRDIVAGATRNGEPVLIDNSFGLILSYAEAPVNPSAITPIDRSFVPSGLATWGDPAGASWLLVPSATTISAWRITSTNGPPTMMRGWTSRQMRAPLTPIVVNGVVFVVSSGEFIPPAGANLSAAERARQSVPAVLYALDAATGRELWNSGATMTSFAHGSALWPGIGQVHVATADNTVYAFGFPMERY